MNYFLTMLEKGKIKNKKVMGLQSLLNWMSKRIGIWYGLAADTMFQSSSHLQLGLQIGRSIFFSDILITTPTIIPNMPLALEVNINAPYYLDKPQKSYITSNQMSSLLVIRIQQSIEVPYDDPSILHLNLVMDIPQCIFIVHNKYNSRNKIKTNHRMYLHSPVAYELDCHEPIGTLS